MKQKHKRIIKEWARDNNRYWTFDTVDLAILKKGEEVYQSQIYLDKLVNCIIKKRELCLAFSGGYTIWLIEDTISFEYYPDNPLFEENE